MKTGFSKDILESIIKEKIDSFFALSPNSEDKIIDFTSFIELNNKLIEVYLSLIHI